MDKIKVLMVDDEEQFRETTAKVLNRRGFETTLAGSGEEAIELMGKSSQDVVVLDIKMPGMGGEEALTQIKKIAPDVRVIMLTGHGGEKSARRSLESQAFDYLAKPCDIDRLAARIHDAYSMLRKDRRGEKKAGDIMIPLEEYTIIRQGSSIAEGIRALQKSFEGLVSTPRLMQTGHRSIMVLNAGGELLGALSIMDLIGGLRPAYLSAPKPSTADSMEYSAMFWTGLFTHQAKALAKMKIEDVMSPPPPPVDSDANLMEVADRLFQHRSRRLAVMRQGKLIGVIREQEIFFELAGILLQG